MGPAIDSIVSRVVCLLRGHDRLYSAVVSPDGWGAIPWECKCVRCGKDLTVNTLAEAGRKLDAAPIPTDDRKVWPPPEDVDAKVKLWPWMKR